MSLKIVNTYYLLCAAGKPVRIGNKSLIDYIVTLSLEIAERHGLPLQIHTGYVDFLRIFNVFVC